MSNINPPLVTMTGDLDAELCGPDGCTIPADHAARTRESTGSEAPTRIAIVTGSTRSGRVNPQVARYILNIAGQREGAVYEILDIADFSLPMYDEPIPALMSSDYRTPEARRWSEAVAGFDGFVFIVAEYNRGISSALKNAIDYLYPEFVDKAAGLVGYGSAGGTSAVRALREILVTLQVATVQAQPTFNLFTDFADMTDFAPAPVHEASVLAMLDQVEKWSKALTTVRASRAVANA